MSENKTGGRSRSERAGKREEYAIGHIIMHYWLRGTSACVHVGLYRLTLKALNTKTSTEEWTESSKEQNERKRADIAQGAEESTVA